MEDSEMGHFHVSVPGRLKAAMGGMAWSDTLETPAA